MAWEAFKSILPKSIAQAGIKGKMTSVRVLEIATKVLLAKWGDNKSVLVIFVSFVDGTLKATSESPAAMQMLNKEKNDFLNRINHELGEKAVHKLDIRGVGF